MFLYVFEGTEAKFVYIPESLNYDEMREHSDHDFLQDYKTSCIPSQNSYISFRARRDLTGTQPDFETYTVGILTVTRSDIIK